MPALSTDVAITTFKTLLGYKALIFPLDWLFNHGSPFALPVDYICKSALLIWFFGLLCWGDFRQSWPFLAAAASYWLLIAAYSALATPIFDNRTLLPGLIPFVGFIAMQSVTISRKRIRAVMLAGWIAITLIFAIGWLGTGAHLPREKWRETADYLSTQYRSGNLVIFYPGYIDGAVQYYLPTLRTEDIFRVELGVDRKSMESELQRRMAILCRKTHPVMFLVVRGNRSALKDKQTYGQLLTSLGKSAGKTAHLMNFDIVAVSKFENP
jgi:sulfur carrier protein ThiS